MAYSALDNHNEAMPEFAGGPVYCNSAAVEKFSSVAEVGLMTKMS